MPRTRSLSKDGIRIQREFSSLFLFFNPLLFTYAGENSKIIFDSDESYVTNSIYIENEVGESSMFENNFVSVVEIYSE